MNVKSKRKKTLIFVGPSFKDSRLKHGMIFRGMPREGDTDILKHLFVPPSRLQTALIEVKTKGTALHTLYQQAVRFHKEGQ